jgi:hypothetical protein
VVSGDFREPYAKWIWIVLVVTEIGQLTKNGKDLCRSNVDAPSVNGQTAHSERLSARRSV